MAHQRTPVLETPIGYKLIPSVVASSSPPLNDGATSTERKASDVANDATVPFSQIGNQTNTILKMTDQRTPLLDHPIDSSLIPSVVASPSDAATDHAISSCVRPLVPDPSESDLKILFDSHDNTPGKMANQRTPLLDHPIDSSLIPSVVASPSTVLTPHALALAVAPINTDPSGILPLRIFQEDLNTIDNVQVRSVTIRSNLPAHIQADLDSIVGRVTEVLGTSFLVDIPPITGVQETILKLMFKQVWQVDAPKPWQLRATATTVFCPTNMAAPVLCLARATADGKSLVVYGTASGRRGVHVVCLPLVAVGCNQLSTILQQVTPGSGVSVEHLDTIRDRGEAKSFAQYLCNLRSMQQESLILLTSPSGLTNSVWKRCFASMATHGVLQSFFVDEYHYISMDGRFFRTDFVDGVKHMFNLCKGVVPVVFCSASSNRPIRDHVSYLMSHTAPTRGGVPRHIGIDSPRLYSLQPAQPSYNIFTSEIHGPMGRPGINVRVSFASKYKPLLKKDMERVLIKKMKILGYSASASRIQDMLQPAMQSVLLESLPTSDRDPSISDHQHTTHPPLSNECLGITGTDGVMWKQFVMDLLSGSYASKHIEVSAIAGTSAVNCGVNAIELSYIFLFGFCRRVIEVVQLLGRLRRGPRPNGDIDELHCMLSLGSFLSLYAMSCNVVNENEQWRQHNELFEVARILVLPDKCLHVVLDEYYKHAHVPSMPPCQIHCDYCRCTHRAYVGVIKKKALVSFLSLQFLDGRKKITELGTAIYKERSRIWAGLAKDVTRGNYQALVLQLYVAGIISISHIPPKKEGATITAKNIVASWNITQATALMPKHLAYEDDKRWACINHV